MFEDNLKYYNKAKYHIEQYKSDYTNAISLRLNFVKDENGFRVNTAIREMVVFAPHNVIKDPPFTKLDILTCRNLLIYMEQELQKKLMNLFHYSWELILLPFYLKSKEKWSGENEWRVVENAQDGQVVYQKINSKGKKIRYIERTMNHNTLKGVFISKSVSIEQEKEINEILSSLSYSFKAKRIE